VIIYLRLLLRWNVAHPLDGIREKTKRAKEHIGNLDDEITTYLDGADHTLAVTTEYDSGKSGYWRNLVISGSSFPERFSVISGEVVHHLRSCLDHLVWQLVVSHGKEAPGDWLEFPIFWERTKYPPAARSKIKGISPAAADVIESFQPYNAAVAVEDHALFVLHALDRIDKHRLLILVAGELNIFGSQTALPSELNKKIVFRLTRTPTAHPDTNYQVSFDIAFDKFGTRRGEPVIPSLQQLTDFVSGVIDSLSAEFR
jgi:hypothetical protein